MEKEPEAEIYIYRILNEGGYKVDSLGKCLHLFNELERINEMLSEEIPELAGKRVWAVWLIENIIDVD